MGELEREQLKCKMATMAGDKLCKSSQGRRKAEENAAFHKIISSFQAVSAHLMRHTLLPQCISLLGFSTFNAKMNLGRGHILLPKYLVLACLTPPFVPCFF